MRSLSPNHYERAFENWLIDNHISYVRSDERRRLGPSEDSVKNFDFLLSTKGGRHVIVEVKGRTFEGSSLRDLSGLECWVTADDIRSLQVWREALGSGHEAVFTFAYRVVRADVDFNGHEPITVGLDRYVFFCIELDDYCRCMKGRSPRWHTVMLSAEDFRRCAVDLSAFLSQSRGQ